MLLGKLLISAWTHNGVEVPGTYSTGLFSSEDKTEVYATKPRNVQDLRKLIITTVRKRLFTEVKSDLVFRLYERVRRQSGHLNDITCKK